MKKITNKEYEAFRKYRDDVVHGRVLTIEGVRMIAGAYDNDPEKIGQHILQILAKESGKNGK